MSVASIKAGAAFYEIFAEDKTANGLSSAEQKLMKFGAKIGMIGAAMTAASAAVLGSLSAMAIKFATVGDEIGDAMVKTGVSPEWLQVFDLAADKADISFTGIVASIGKMQRAINDGQIQKGLDLLGMSVAQLGGLSPDEQFLTLADAIGKIQDPAKRSAAAIAVFGRSGVGLLPLIEGGVEGLQESFDKLKGQGLLFNKEDIEIAGRLDDALVMIRWSFGQMVSMIGAAVAPALADVLNIAQPIVATIAKFVSHNRELVVGVAIGAVVLGGLGVVLMGVGAAMIGLSLATTGLTASLTALGVVAGILGSPMLGIAALIFAVGFALISVIDGTILGSAGFNALAGSIVGAYNAFKLLWMAVSNGRWDLAGNLIKNGLLTGFYGAILAIKEAWNDLIQWMVQGLANAFKEIDAKLPDWAPGKGAITDAANGLEMAAKVAGEGNLSDDRKAVLDAAMELAKTVAEIGKVEGLTQQKRQRQLGGVGFGAALANQLDSFLSSSSAGTSSSAGAANIGRAAGANIIAEKQLDAQEKGNELLEDIKGAVEDLEVLTVE